MKKSTFINSIQIEANYNLHHLNDGAKAEILALINKNKDNLVDRIKQDMVDNFFATKYEGDFTKRYISIPSSTSTVISVSLSKGGETILCIEDQNNPQFFNATEQEVQNYASGLVQPAYAFYGNGVYIISGANYVPADTGIKYAITVQKYPDDYTTEIFNTDDDTDINFVITQNDPISLLPPEMHNALIRMVVRDLLNTPVVGGSVPQARLDSADARVELETTLGLRALKDRNANRIIVQQKPVSRYG